MSGNGGERKELRNENLLAIIFGLMLVGCAEDPQITQLREARLRRHAAFEERMAQIRAIPDYQQRQAAYDRLSKELDAQIQRSQEQDRIDAQRELADAIDDLNRTLRGY